MTNVNGGGQRNRRGSVPRSCIGPVVEFLGFVVGVLVCATTWGCFIFLWCVFGALAVGVGSLMYTPVAVAVVAIFGDAGGDTKIWPSSIICEKFWSQSPTIALIMFVIPVAFWVLCSLYLSLFEAQRYIERSAFCRNLRESVTAADRAAAEWWWKEPGQQPKEVVESTLPQPPVFLIVIAEADGGAVVLDMGGGQVAQITQQLLDTRQERDAAIRREITTQTGLSHFRTVIFRNVVSEVAGTGLSSATYPT